MKLTRRHTLLFCADMKRSAALPRDVPHQTLAFYYGWYGNPQVSGRWRHWRDVNEAARTIGESTHDPQLGPYDSHDPKVVEQHCRWAREAGITGFIVSWWVQGDFHDQGMPLMLDTARKHSLKVTIYYEIVPPHENPAVEGAVGDLLYLLEKYSSHPAWLRVNDQPVFFIYGRAVGQIKLDGWKEVIRQVRQRRASGALFIGDRISAEAAAVFDGIHTYNITGRIAGKSPEEIRRWAAQTFPEWVRTAGDKISCLTVIPGYDDTKLDRKPPRPTTDRHGGQTYAILWEQAIAAQPDWILVTSWNEWHEGSEIEPSYEHGDAALKATRKFACRFLKL